MKSDLTIRYVLDRCKAKLARRAPEHDIDSGKDGCKARSRDLSDASLQELPIESDDLGDVCDRGLGEAGLAGRQEDIAGSAGPFDLGGERHADDGGQSTSAQSVALDHEHWATEPRTRTGRVAKISPPDFSLTNHHSEFSRTLRAAR